MQNNAELEEVLVASSEEAPGVVVTDDAGEKALAEEEGADITHDQAQAVTHLINKIGAVLVGEKIADSVIAMALMIVGAINDSSLDIDTRKRLAMTWCTAAAEVSTNIGLEFKDIAAAFANGVSHAKQ